MSRVYPHRIAGTAEKPAYYPLLNKPMKKITCLAIVWVALLVGCGGGAGDVNATTPPPVAPATTNSIFSDPVAMTCQVQTAGKTCNAPTASYGGSELIQAALTDPLAGAMTIKSFGYSWLQYTRLESSGAAFIPTAGSMAFDGSEEEVKLGVGAIAFQGATYTFDKTYPHASGKTGRIYCRVPKDCIYTVPTVLYETQPAAEYGKLVDLHKTQTNGTVVTGGVTIMETNASEWDAYIGLLTDRLSVVLPSSNRITYSGIVYVVAGDGTPLGNWFKGGVVGCPIVLTLNTSNGDITTPGASCTTGDGGSLDFALETVVVDQSKVRPILIADAALVSGFVMSGTTAPKIKTPFTFRSTKIAGGVYGSNAETLTIFGSSPTGVFQIVGNRAP